jgi:hypothetical protein
MVNSPSTRASTTQPLLAVRDRSTTAISPGKRPARIMLSPAILTAKVAAGFSISSSLKSSGRSR